MNQYESHRLAKSIGQLYIDGTWIAGTNISEVLTDVTWVEAKTSIAGLNSIGMLVYHLDYYTLGLIQVMNGGTLEIRDQFSFEAPELTTPLHWQERKSLLIDHVQTFKVQIENQPSDIWNKPFVKETYGTYRRNIEGVIRHGYYHFGQIVLIKKLIRGRGIAE